MSDKINILLIEDNPADSELISIFLKGVYGSRPNIVIANTLAKGLQLMEGDASMDVILLDLSLPDSGGLDTLNKLHAKAPDTPIIVLTGNEDETIGIEAVKIGAQDFLVKGKVKSRDIQRSINYSIERNKLVQALSAKTRELEEKNNELQNKEQKLALAHKIANIGGWEWDLTEGKATWSDELFDMQGIESEKESFSFRKLLSRIHPHDRSSVWNVITQSIRTLKPLSFYYRVIREDGSIRTFYSIGEVVVDDQGKPIKVVGTRQDVTERIQEEEMQKLSLAASQSFNSVVITDKNGTIEWVNEGFTKLTGYTLDEVKGTHGEVLRRGEHTGISQDTGYYSQVIKEKKPVLYESKNYSKEGKGYWTITTLTPVLDDKGRVGRIIAIDSDITQRKQMEEDLRRANEIADDLLHKSNKLLVDLKQAKKELEITMQIKEQFLANMSHEIRTPMNAIVGFTQLLLKTNPTAEQKQYIDIIKTSGANLLVIVNDILDFSKLSSGKVNFEQIEFSLKQTIASVTKLLLPKAHEKNIKLSTNIDENIYDSIIGDPTRLGQMLMNLLSNAIKFSDHGEVKITVVRVREDGGQIELRFSVIDTGIGIPEDKLPDIFEAFTQASSETTRKYGGTGLGLAIVKQLAEQQGGSVAVDSKVNKGSVFSFTLPFKKGTGQLKSQEDVTREFTKAMPAGGLKVLLVEDNELNALLAEKVLSDWNWKVDVADNGFIALEKMQQKDFDIVLMDIQMPGMDGCETTRRIRKELQPPKKDVPIIAMTAHALTGEQEKCFEAGMDGYISKPFEPEQLYMKITTLLEINSQLNGKDKSVSVKEQYPKGTQNAPHIAADITSTGHYTDLTYLRGLAKGNTAFIIQMLNIFIEQTPHSMERMEKALQSKDWKTLRMVVHKIKPSIMFTGLKEITNDVPLLEDYAAEERNLDEVPALVNKITAVCTHAIAELKEEVEKLNKLV